MSSDIERRLERIEQLLEMFIRQKAVKEFYSTAEAAEILCLAEWTVREMCRLSRCVASKKKCGRGRAREWMISHEELQRIQNEGWLPDPRLIRRQSAS